MNSQLLYQADITVLEFDAQVIEKRSLENGRWGILLDQTYFYPSGGGQESDTGYLDGARVLQVEKIVGQEPVRLMHMIDRDLPLGQVHARIDAERRLRHMQHHSAQHLLSQCFIQLYEIDSLSANINGETPSTLDLAVAGLSRQQIEKVEEYANQIIYEDRPIRTYFVSPEELHQLPLRWPPKVNENIRIVEIAGFDYTPCGGTHCLSTGSIGIVKILKTERQNDQVRLFFVAGRQALNYFKQYQEITVSLANQLSVHPNELLEIVSRQVEQLKTAQKELHKLRSEQLALEAQRLVEAAPSQAGIRVVCKAFADRSASELRTLAAELAKKPALVAILGASDGKKIALAVVCAPESPWLARDLLNDLLSLVGGRGGGDARLAYGGGAGDIPQLMQLITVSENKVRSQLAE